MSKDNNRQIKQMVNFIMQEAHEKVNEIRIKVTFSTFITHWMNIAFL